LLASATAIVGTPVDCVIVAGEVATSVVFAWEQPVNITVNNMTNIENTNIRRIFFIFISPHAKPA
jgi:hypothetical protein